MSTEKSVAYARVRSCEDADGQKRLTIAMEMPSSSSSKGGGGSKRTEMRRAAAEPLSAALGRIARTFAKGCSIADGRGASMDASLCEGDGAPLRGCAPTADGDGALCVSITNDSGWMTGRRLRIGVPGEGGAATAVCHREYIVLRDECEATGISMPKRVVRGLPLHANVLMQFMGSASSLEARQ